MASKVKKPKTGVRVIGFKDSSGLFEKLQEVAEREQRSVSFIIRRAAIAELQRCEKES